MYRYSYNVVCLIYFVPKTFSYDVALSHKPGLWTSQSRDEVDRVTWPNVYSP